MNPLVAEIRKLSQDEGLSSRVRERLEDFEGFQGKSKEHWFSELCFCILTANSKARTALSIQEELGPEGFCNYDGEQIKSCIMANRHRFHNNKTRYILEARSQKDIKSLVQALVKKQGTKDARGWLADNIKGMGYKEASHFLRNVGYKDLAILDRHIINLMLENGYLEKKPSSLDKKNYLEIEKKLGSVARELGMSHAELDLYMWYMKGGDILK